MRSAGKRVRVKVKHFCTADCVVASFRWHKQGRGELIGSLLLGLYDAHGAVYWVDFYIPQAGSRAADCASTQSCRGGGAKEFLGAHRQPSIRRSAGDWAPAGSRLRRWG